MTTAAQHVFAIAGRRFVAVAPPLTASHRLYLAGELAACGLDQARATISAAGTPVEGSRDVFVRAVRSGRLPWLVAGFLVELGTRWSTEKANERATLFAELTEAADLAAFDLAVIAALAMTIQTLTGGNISNELAALGSALEDVAGSRLPASHLH